MAGGDDLESDDEYLDQSWLNKQEEVLVTLDETIRKDDDELRENNGSKKRGISAILNDDEPEVSSKTKKPKNLLLEAGRGISEANPDVQAAFLWTTFSHTLNLKGDNIDEVEKFTSSQFATAKMIDTKKSKYEKSLATFLKGGVIKSMKKLKKWKEHNSPMVLVICVSARRAVALLKEISSLNVRAAKLFAKHMSVEDQIAMLDNNTYGIGVGTPNRLLKLFETGRDDKNEGGLSLAQTELIIIDCQEDNKRFTVCTMNDTAPDLMTLIHKAVLPQMSKRKNIKFAMF
jgi:hypothetical protein